MTDNAAKRHHRGGRRGLRRQKRESILLEGVRLVWSWMVVGGDSPWKQAGWWDGRVSRAGEGTWERTRRTGPRRRASCRRQDLLDQQRRFT